MSWLHFVFFMLIKQLQRRRNPSVCGYRSMSVSHIQASMRPSGGLYFFLFLSLVSVLQRQTCLCYARKGFLSCPRLLLDYFHHPRMPSSCQPAQNPKRKMTLNYTTIYSVQSPNPADVHALDRVHCANTPPAC